ncbi:MAG: molecular chaperone HtpG [Proteobacteria bacterium]|nr:molecular chaperone HtpG [Pseudomonadota bacterium]
MRETQVRRLKMSQEIHSFQAETQQLLNLMIHSLYSNKEIFLRELISNASDALDKVRFEEITKTTLLTSKLEAGIRLSVKADERKLIIEDTGIGMTRDELIANLGTIASSGTKKFLEKLSESDKKDAQLIGQFGVGFYSAFMVAEKITVETRPASGGDAWLWESQGNGTYALNSSTREERGTRIELLIKEDEKEFLEEWRLKGIVRKYSDYVTYPVLWKDKEDKEERLNKSTPVWARQKKDNTPEDYKELYKQLSNDWQEPLMWEHIHAEGLMPFQAVAFVPSAVPFDLYQRDSHGLHLYVRRVSITDKCKELIPEYLRFVSGVVETDELPLNVSREILQQNNKLPAIRKQIVKKILSSLQNLAKNETEKYNSFYAQFGAVLKEGFHFDHDNHEALAELARFRSTKTGPDGWVSLKEYWERKADAQKEIYFLSGPSFEAVSASPHLESLTSRGIEVLFLTDPIDEWFVMDYPKFGEAALKSVAKGQLDLDGVGTEPRKSENEEQASPEQLAPLLEVFRRKCSDALKDVKISNRLVDSPCCLVADEHGLSAHMERLMKATNKEFAGNKRILEVNPSHPIILSLVKKAQNNSADTALEEWVEVLYDTALLAEGSPVRNPGVFAKKLTKMLEMQKV